jgi:hypothetical protein
MESTRRCACRTCSACGRNESLAVAAVAAIVRDLHLITQGVPHVTGVHAVIERFDTSTRMKPVQMHLACKGAGVMLTEDVVTQTPELAQSH